MKTIEELNEIRKRAWDKVNPGIDRKNPRIVVGMATCGIAAGAKPVYDAIKDEIINQSIDDIEIAQTGCIGICKLEPVVEVYMPGKEKVTYVKVTPTMCRRIIREHIMNGKVIDEYTMHVVQGKVLNDYTVLN